MLAKEAEDMGNRNRLLGLNFFLLYHPGLGGGLDSTPPPLSESLRHDRAAGLAPWPLGPALCPRANPPCCVTSLGPPCPRGVGGWAPKQHRPFFPCPLPQRDLTFFLDCLY